MAKVKVIDIAKSAGLSPSTVSFVLNGKGDEMHISKATQEKVVRLANDMGYNRNIFSRKLRLPGQELSPLIAVFIPDTLPKYHKRKILININASIVDIGSDAGLCTVTFTTDKFAEELTAKSAELYTGAMMFGLEREHLEILEDMKVKMPVLVFNDESSVYNSVFIDSFDDGVKLCEPLIKKGCKRVIYLISGDFSNHVTEAIKGCQKACEEAGVTLELMNVKSNSYENGARVARDLCVRGPLPDAILSVDTLSLGIAHELTGRGVDLEKDLHLIGSGTLDFFDFLDYPISQSFLSIKKMYDTSVEMLIDCIKNMNFTPTKLRFENTLTLRGGLKDIL